MCIRDRFQLGLEISRRLESGEWTLDTLESLVAELECEGLQRRARKLARLIGPVEIAANQARIRSLAEAGDFTAFAARWGRPLAHIVFTAHPTFLLNKIQTQAVAAAASSGDPDVTSACVTDASRDTITLDSEHDAALAAISRAQTARDTINATLFAAARERWPGRWRELQPLPLRFASWVGYDMDGRTCLLYTSPSPRD